MPAGLFVYGVALFFSVKGQQDREIERHLFSWIVAGNFKVEAGLLIDPLSLVFVLLITGVGGLIHIYAFGYLSGDPGRRRFFGYFNLFIASMLLLVLGDNYLSLYVGWEGVGRHVLPVDQLLLQPQLGCDGRQQGVLRQPGR